MKITKKLSNQPTIVKNLMVYYMQSMILEVKKMIIIKEALSTGTFLQPCETISWGAFAILQPPNVENINCCANSDKHPSKKIMTFKS